MKKLFLVLAAAFAMVACQSDINEVGVAGGEVDVTFEVGTPTRAYSDGTTATVLQYAVYEGETELDALTHSVAKGNAETINISKTVSFKLVTGNTYTVIFWAASPNAPYTVDFGAKTMTVDYDGVKSNNENLDAFYKRHTFTVTGAQTETIELRRPFAQLNIGTSDFEAAEKAGYTADQSFVKVTKLGDVLNLWNDKVEGTDAVITFDYAAIPTTETFPVTGYEYLAMNYLLVDSEKEVVDIEFGYKETSTGDAKTRTVGSVPVQRNYRTNIYGQLLTSDVDINVEIKPEYEGVHNGGAASGNVTYVENLAQLQAALAMPAAEKGPHHYIYFTEDIAGDATILQTADLCLVIDGQGHKFDGTFLVNGNARSTGAETLTFQNIAFESATAKTFISAPSKINNKYNYSHNVTVKDCSFKGNWANGVEVGGVSLTGTYYPAILNCTADNMHSLCQFQSVDNDIRIEDVTITNGKNGIALGNAANVTIKNANVTAEYYGIRADGNGDRGNLVIEESTIEAKQPIVVRKVTTPKYAITLGANVTLTTAESYHVVFTTGSDDAAYTTPDTAHYSIEGADNYMVYPRDTVADYDAFLAKISDDNWYDATKNELLIEDVADFAAFVETVNSVDNFEGKTLKLTDDIDLYFNDITAMADGDPITFRPIGDTKYGAKNPFKGTFDGQGHTIKNLYQNGWDLGYNWDNYGSYGLFGKLEDATVKNVVLEGSESYIEGGDVSFIAGSATGNCVFEDITIKSGKIATYNNGCGGIIGWSGAGNYTFKNIVIESDVVLGGMWGSFDSSIGGIVGQAEPGATYNFENVEINCRIDAYNDCTASYDYYNYRMCGMVIGRCEETTTIGGKNYPDLSKYTMSFNNVTVNYGQWMYYHYCRVSGERAARVEPGYQYGGIAADRDHSKDNQHCKECIPFDQLIGGDQFGVKGLPAVTGITVNYPAAYTCPTCGNTHGE